MSLRKYASAAGGLIEELRESLSEEEWAVLEKNLFQNEEALTSFLKWQEDEGLSEISAFLAATPSVRNKRKKWQEPELKRRLTLGAMLLAHQGQVLLLYLDRASQIEGASYRDGAAYAGKLLHELQQSVGEYPFLFSPLPKRNWSEPLDLSQAYKKEA